jgi:hypothetical protein
MFRNPSRHEALDDLVQQLAQLLLDLRILGPVASRLALQELHHFRRQLARVLQRLEDRFPERLEGTVPAFFISPPRVPSGKTRLQEEVSQLVE